MTKKRPRRRNDAKKTKVRLRVCDWLYALSITSGKLAVVMSTTSESNAAGSDAK